MSRLLTSMLLFFMIMADLAGQVNFSSGGFLLSVSETGRVIEMKDLSSGTNYIAPEISAPLLKIRIDTSWSEPSVLNWDGKKRTFALKYPEQGVTVTLRVDTKSDHLAFHIASLDEKGKKYVNAVCWGPYPLTISETISEVVGVVRNTEFAIGIQALNPETVGAILKNDGGTDDSRGSAAIARPYGSSLQAYCLDRSRPRIVTAWGNKFPGMPVKPIPGATVAGSGIALFGCREKEVLDRIASIETTWDLPHPLINGVWHKQSPETGRAYLISDFSEKNIDEMLAYTKRAGLMSLYHEGPFQSWGHFIPDSTHFPGGLTGIKKCVEKANEMDIRIGVHTLTTFINTNDPYVTPVPDPRLAETGSSIIIADIDANIDRIPVQSDKYFLNLKESTLHAVRIGTEIIRFREVTASEPYVLIDCQRGAFGTRPSPHKKGEKAAMLMDYPYQTLFPDFGLQQEIAGNLARFFNETGVSHLDFDGHEGCMSSGEGEYAMQIFADKVFRETKHTLVNGTSRSSHYYWHICHYWNWGEPWYGGFRESQGDYRLDNQPFLERNYMPNMLGWFLLSATTGPEDIEWMMARAAGYKAGFALVARYNSLKNNPDTEKLLDLISLWQEASHTAIFNKDQIARLKDPGNDFHLEKDESGWKLYPFSKYQFSHAKQLLQPGQPAFSEWRFENTDPGQPLSFQVTFTGEAGKVRDLWIELDGFYRLEIPGEFDAGSSVVCDGKSLKLYNSKGRFVSDLKVNQTIVVLKEGSHTLKFSCSFPEESEIRARFVIKTIGDPETIKAVL